MADNKLKEIYGGALSGTVLNAISRLINTLLDLGRAIGSSIRRSQTNNKC